MPYTNLIESGYASLQDYNFFLDWLILRAYYFVFTGLPLLGKPSLKFGRSSMSEMVFPWDVCYVVQFHWLHRDLFEMCNLYGALSLASTGNDVILPHCSCFRPFHDLGNQYL